jgi:hypothetical protein
MWISDYTLASSSIEARSFGAENMKGAPLPIVSGWHGLRNTYSSWRKN